MKKLSKLLLALSFVLSVTTSAFAATVVYWGGAYTESQKLGYGDPTAKKLGIPVNWVDYTGGLSEIKAQKEAGKITCDTNDSVFCVHINDVPSDFSSFFLSFNF